MDGYWLILQLGDEEEAKSLFERYRQREIPAVLFWNTFMEDYLVAAYADNPMHQDANREVGFPSYVDGYMGTERLAECLFYHVLLDYGSPETDES